MSEYKLRKRRMEVTKFACAACEVGTMDHGDNAGGGGAREPPSTDESRSRGMTLASPALACLAALQGFCTLRVVATRREPSRHERGPFDRQPPP